MDRKEFLQRLSCALIKLPEYDRAEAVSFYDEIISDKVEAGMSEQEAVASLGDINSLRAYITAASVENNLLGREDIALTADIGRGEFSEKDGVRHVLSTTKTEVDGGGIKSVEAGITADICTAQTDTGSKTETCRCSLCGGVTNGFVSAEGAQNNGQSSQDVKPETKIEKIKRKIKGTKAPLKSFFTMLAVCTSPILIILGATFLIVIASLLISFAAVGVSLVAGSLASIVYAVVTAYFVGTSVGVAAGFMSFFAYLFAAALLAVIAVWFFKLAQIIIKSVVLLFARLIKRNKRGKLTAKEGA